MKKLIDMAFDAADAYCDCKEGEVCFANSFLHGFVAGYKKALSARRQPKVSVHRMKKKRKEETSEN